ncbi:hypothetical protein ACIOTI_42555 [Streptomyces sp. NPDC087843]|uniref:hypothetical protein n=1 Tax=Streptomyces sp. NPDC087843 TaxID=3365804 RepID=UPI003808E5DD
MTRTTTRVHGGGSAAGTRGQVSAGIAGPVTRLGQVLRLAIGLGTDRASGEGQGCGVLKHPRHTRPGRRCLSAAVVV